MRIHVSLGLQVMSMCFRMCLTNNASNSIPITAPEGYSVEKMGVLRQEILAATKLGYKLTLDSMFLVRYLPESKIDLNSGSWSVQNSSGGYVASTGFWYCILFESWTCDGCSCDQHTYCTDMYSPFTRFYACLISPSPQLTHTPTHTQTHIHPW